MRVLDVRNAHEALPKAIKLIRAEGDRRDSRNGPVILPRFSVTTVYREPMERVVFWPERDANPFFHLYEALWMLAGRDDVAGPMRYAKNIANYSDDGITLHGAYGYRWRSAFELSNFEDDQLGIIARQLIENPEDRRCVLQMWHSEADLGKKGKDVPCNLTATFQRDFEGKLDLTVFCRSNDIIWGAYGANAVHFGFLLEYMAAWIKCPVGVYRQVSVNWHAYLDTLMPLESLGGKTDAAGYLHNPYTEGEVSVIPMAGDGDLLQIDSNIAVILAAADEGNMRTGIRPPASLYPWAHNVYTVLEAHEVYRAYEGEERYSGALRQLLHTQHSDWSVAAAQWLQRRYDRWKQKTGLLKGSYTHP